MDNIQLALQMNAAIRLLAQNLEMSDDEKMQIADLYPDWQINKAYKVGEIVKFGLNSWNETQLYKVVQAHTSQSDWTPDAAASLFSKIGFSDNGTPIWTQPLGAHDAYGLGDVVSHNGKTWKSNIPANVYEPGVYGWDEVKGGK